LKLEILFKQTIDDVVKFLGMWKHYYWGNISLEIDRFSIAAITKKKHKTICKWKAKQFFKLEFLFTQQGIERAVFTKSVVHLEIT
jgi:hypothetical protein